MAKALVVVLWTAVNWDQSEVKGQFANENSPDGFLRSCQSLFGEGWGLYCVGWGSS